MAIAPLHIAQNKQASCELLPGLANRHGLITGATGTGKTVTLQTLAERFSAIGVPVQYTDVTASITGPRGRTLGTEDKATQFADMLVTPIAAGYHFDELNHIAFSLPIYVPTGAYNDNRLANPGQNNYTFMPTVAFTHLDGKGGEFTLSSGLEFYTENTATDYRNGNIFTLDSPTQNNDSSKLVGIEILNRWFGNGVFQNTG